MGRSFAARRTPFQAAALNERSSLPPASKTMPTCTFDRSSAPWLRGWQARAARASAQLRTRREARCCGQPVLPLMMATGGYPSAPPKARREVLAPFEPAGLLLRAGGSQSQVLGPHEVRTKGGVSPPLGREEKNHDRVCGVTPSGQIVSPLPEGGPTEASEERRARRAGPSQAAEL